jgi:hypothetical protein
MGVFLGPFNDEEYNKVLASRLDSVTDHIDFEIKRYERKIKKAEQMVKEYQDDIQHEMTKRGVYVSRDNNDDIIGVRIETFGLDKQFIVFFWSIFDYQRYEVYKVMKELSGKIDAYKNIKSYTSDEVYKFYMDSLKEENKDDKPQRFGNMDKEFKEDKIS